MPEFFYRPENAWAADFIPFYKDGAFHLFYLLDWRNREEHGEGTPWYQISTRDFVHFKEHGEMLGRGAADDQDLYVYTGCVIEAEGEYHIFYTGHNPHKKAAGLPEQAVMHAVSGDLDHWTKLPEDTFYAPDHTYEPDDWRDPFVFWNEEAGEYWMLLAARLTNSPKIRKGCTAVCASKDLKTWEVREPLWAPDLYFTHECPDLFRMGDWWYLVFSEFTDRCVTRYRMAKSLNGPWISPANDTFDGRAYYAAKTASNGKQRYIFGWNPTKEGNDDNNGWQWGGNLVVHEVFQHADGTLGCRIPETVRESFTSPIFPGSCDPITWTTACKDTENELDAVFDAGTGKTESQIVLTAIDNAALSLFDTALPSSYKLEVSVKFKKGTQRCGIMLNAKPDQDNAYCFFLEPNKKQFAFDFWPNHPWGRFNTRGCSRLIELLPDTTHEITVIVDGTICVAYLDGEVALNGRMYGNEGGQAGIIVCDGEAEFTNPVITAL